MGQVSENAGKPAVWHEETANAEAAEGPTVLPLAPSSPRAPLQVTQSLAWCLQVNKGALEQRPASLQPHNRGARTQCSRVDVTGGKSTPHFKQALTPIK